MVIENDIYLKLLRGNTFFIESIYKILKIAWYVEEIESDYLYTVGVQRRIFLVSWRYWTYRSFSSNYRLCIRDLRSYAKGNSRVNEEMNIRSASGLTRPLTRGRTLDQSKRRIIMRHLHVIRTLVLLRIPLKTCLYLIKYGDFFKKVNFPVGKNIRSIKKVY